MEYKPPKDRKHPYIYQAYLIYFETLELKKKHENRIKAIKQGRSNMDLTFEEQWMEEGGLLKNKKMAGEMLADSGAMVGPIWNWLTSIKGLGGGLFAAQLIALIDDIEKFETVYKLRRFAGYAVFNGKAEPRGKYKAPHDKEEIRHYNGKLKGLLYNIVGSFLKAQTPHYSDIYYEYKARQREKYPIPICRNCKIECMPTKRKKKGEEYNVYVCPNDARHIKNYSDSHLHTRAVRKVACEFLKDLWLEWRKSEGLPISEPWTDG
jgi:hypothetical protein